MNGEKGMDVFYMFLLFLCGIGAAYLIIKLQDENLFGKKSEHYNSLRELRKRNEELEKTLNSNILTIGLSNQKIEEVKKDLACFTAKIDKTDLELDNLQEHCAKLRESLIDVKEVVASKRPIHRHDPINITLSPQIFKAMDIKKVKKQIEEVK